MCQFNQREYVVDEAGFQWQWIWSFGASPKRTSDDESVYRIRKVPTIETARSHITVAAWECGGNATAVCEIIERFPLMEAPKFCLLFDGIGARHLSRVPLGIWAW